MVLAQIITSIISIENKTALQNTTGVLVPILFENNE